MIRATLLLVACLAWYGYSMVAAVQTVSEPKPFEPILAVDVYYA